MLGFSPGTAPLPLYTVGTQYLLFETEGTGQGESRSHLTPGQPPHV